MSDFDPFTANKADIPLEMEARWNANWHHFCLLLRATALDRSYQSGRSYAEEYRELLLEVKARLEEFRGSY